jgi:hypothetical protein
MFARIKTFAAAHETAVTATLSVAAAVVVGAVVMKLDNSTTEDYPTQD